MKAVTVSITLCLAVLVASVPVHAGNTCRTVQGNLDESLIYSNDPFGRVMGSVSGALAGSETATRTSVSPGPTGLTFTTLNIFVINTGDLLVGTGVGASTLTSGGSVSWELTLTVDPALSTGRYAGATGTINFQGTGDNAFGPGFGPGSTEFHAHYKGSLCRD